MCTCPPMVLFRHANANIAPALRLALAGESLSNGFFFSGFLRRIFNRSWNIINKYHSNEDH